MSAPTEPEYLTIREAAVLLRCCPDTVRAGIRRGELSAVRVGRVVRLPRARLAGAGVDNGPALEAAAA
jgi:excisionase family DNA binding protein